MMRTTLTYLGFVWLFAGLTTIRIPAADPVTLPDAEQFDVTSRAGRTYRIFVSPPAGPVPENGWPVIYLSDGNRNFPVLRSAVHRLAIGGPPAVVVGVGYPSNDPKVQTERRAYDLTPPTSAEWLARQPKGPNLGKVGGADEFRDFLVKELKPRMSQKFKFDTKRQALFGHSLGGLFALHVLFTTPDAFQTYLVSSPSIWWDDESIVKGERPFLTDFAPKDIPVRVLISVGEWEEKAASNVPPARAALLK